ncbi:MAG: hypothetical protein K2X27_14400 [Candidatus Obscuribacterales bacterium]|nr:hypothetical protein [Candidatus Obscuribacterales bacterium]
MSMIKRRLTEVAVDSVTDYLKEKFEKLKELDLDHDGQKDVDQLLEILENCGRLSKTAVQSMDFQKIAAGLDQVFSGLNTVVAAVDRDALGAASNELSKALVKLGALTQLGVREFREKGSLTDS